MLIAHAFLTLLAGFASMMLLVGIAAVLLKKLAPEWVGATGNPNPGYAFFNLSYSFAAAGVGGYVTTWMARNSPLTFMMTLALIALLLSALSALQQRGQQPIWYQLLLVALMPIGVLCGGLLQLRLAGLL